MIHCPGCSAGLRFDIPSQRMHCDYCGGSYDPYQFDNAREDAKSAELFDAYVWVCPSCGGELTTTDETDAVGFCPYCGGASLLYDRVRQQWRPKYVIPFALTKEQCKEAYLKEARRHLFVSRKYKQRELIDSFRGIYMPFWDYKATQKGAFSLEAVGPASQEGKYLKVPHYNLKGNMVLALDGCTHDASSAFDDRISEDLIPFDASAQKPFAPGYLSGFYADIGDVPSEQYQTAAGQQLAGQTIRTLTQKGRPVHQMLRDYGLTLIPSECRIPTGISDVHRVLYPVWFMSYRSGDRLTYAAVNGQTGKVSADFPTSPWKLLLLAGGIAALLFLLFSLLPSVKASTAALLVGLLTLAGNYMIDRAYQALIRQNSELEKTPEAARFVKGSVWRYGLCSAAAFIGLVLRLSEPAYNFGPYAFCILMAGMLIWFIFRFIRFQLDVSRRRPPQFNKKGVSADET